MRRPHHRNRILTINLLTQRVLHHLQTAPDSLHAAAHILLSEDAIRFTLRSYVIMRKLIISNDPLVCLQQITKDLKNGLS